MADAERVDKTIERNLPPLLDSFEQVTHRGFAVAFFILQLDLLIARLEGKNVRWLLDPFSLEEQLDLLLAQPLDIKGATRAEQFQMLDLLERTGELAGTAGPRALLAGRGFLAHDVGVEITRAFLWKMIRLGVLRTLIYDHIDNLWNNIAGALNDDGIADANIAAFPKRLPVSANAFDVVLVVQRNVLDDHATNANWLELTDWRERTGTANLQLDVLEHGHRSFSREFMRDRPARRA